MKIGYIYNWHMNVPGQIVKLSDDISPFNGEKDWQLEWTNIYLSSTWCDSWIRVLFYEGYEIEVLDPRGLYTNGHDSIRFSSELLSSYDILVVTLKPELVKTMNDMIDGISENTKIITVESDPYGGIDGVNIWDLYYYMSVYEKSHYIVPMSFNNNPLYSLFAEKAIKVPFGVDTKFMGLRRGLKINDISVGEKTDNKTALMFQQIIHYSNFLNSINMLLNHGYTVFSILRTGENVSRLTRSKLENLNMKMDDLFGKGNVFLIDFLPHRNHLELISKSHLCLSLSLTRSGLAIPYIAALGVPCVTLNNNYYQRIYYPEILPDSISEADKILGNSKLLEESGRNAKKIASELCVHNPKYRKLVADKFTEIYDR